MAVSFKVVSYPGSFIMDGKTRAELKMAYSRLSPYIVIRFYNPSTERYQDYFFESSQVNDKTLSFLPDESLIRLAGISASDTYKTIRMAVWMADSDRERVSEYEFVSVHIRMPAPVLNEGWITLTPYKTMNDFKPGDRFIKGYHMLAVLNTDNIILAKDTTITWLAGSSGGTQFQTSLFPNPSNPGGVFTGQVIGVLNTAGDVDFSFTVTDSRGQKSSQTFTVHVYEYFSPTISGVSVFRCNKDGAADEDGHYLSVKADIRYSHMDGAITLTDCYAEFRETASEEPEHEDIESGNAIVVGGGNITAAQSYYLKIFVQDSTLASAQYETVLSSAKASFNIMEGGHGAAFGRLASRANVLDCVWDISSDGGICAGAEQQSNGAYTYRASMDKDGNIRADGDIHAGGELILDGAIRGGDIYTNNVNCVAVDTNDIVASTVNTDTAQATTLGTHDLYANGDINFDGTLNANGGIAGITNYPAMQAGAVYPPNANTDGIVYEREELTGGTWINGKPIYRYTWMGICARSGSQGTYGNIPGGEPETVISLRGMFQRPSDKAWFPIPFAYYGDINYCVNVRTSGSGQLTVGFGDEYSKEDKPMILIAEYTKK